MEKDINSVMHKYKTHGVLYDFLSNSLAKKYLIRTNKHTKVLRKLSWCIIRLYQCTEYFLTQYRINKETIK